MCKAVLTLFARCKMEAQGYTHINIPHIHKVLILSQQGHMTEVTITVHDCCSAHSVFKVPHLLKATHLLVTCQDKE